MRIGEVLREEVVMTRRTFMWLGVLFAIPFVGIGALCGGVIGLLFLAARRKTTQQVIPGNQEENIELQEVLVYEIEGAQGPGQTEGQDDQGTGAVAEQGP